MVRPVNSDAVIDAVPRGVQGDCDGGHFQVKGMVGRHDAGPGLILVRQQGELVYVGWVVLKAKSARADESNQPLVESGFQEQAFQSGFLACRSVHSPRASVDREGQVPRSQKSLVESNQILYLVDGGAHPVQQTVRVAFPGSFQLNGRVLALAMVGVESQQEGHLVFQPGKNCVL